MPAFSSCCEPVTGAGGAAGGCCNLADTLTAGNTTGGSDIIVTTADAIRGQTNLVLAATAGDVRLTPSSSAYVGIAPIVTGGASLGGTVAVFAGQSAPGIDGSNLEFIGLTAGAGITLTPGIGDVVIAALGGAAATWAATLATGNVSGGTDPIISTGDVLRGQLELNLLAGGDGGDWTGAAADATTPGNGGQTILRSGAGFGGNDGGFLDIIAGNGDGSGSGGRMWARGGQGGPTNGQGGVGRLSGGQGTAAGDGGVGMVEGGPATAGQGGWGRCRGGDSNGSPGIAQLLGGSSIVSGPGANAEVTGGLPATVGAGGSVRLIPQAGVGGGATGIATVGNQTILTTCSSAGAGTSVVRSKDAGTVNGANQTFRSFTSTGGTIAITTPDADTMNLEATGGALSSGSEIQFTITGFGAVASTLRRVTARGRQAAGVIVEFDLPSGTADVTLQYRSVVNGQTTTLRARNIQGRSNLGNTFSAGATSTITNATTTFVTAITMNVNAGRWIVQASLDLEPPP